MGMQLPRVEVPGERRPRNNHPTSNRRESCGHSRRQPPLLCRPLPLCCEH